MNPDQEKTLKPSPSSDEIDLSTVFSSIVNAIGSFFKSIFRILFAFTDHLFSNIRLLIILTLLGAGLGVVYFFVVKPYYRSSMTLSSDYFKGELLDNSIQNINEVCEERNSKVLASLLNIPIQKANKIKSIAVSPVISQNYKMLIDLYSKDKKNQGKLDSLLLYQNQGTFQLNVEVYDTAALKGLDTVLINYIKGSEYVKKRIEIDRINLANLREKLNRESTSLDTLKRSIATSLRKQGDAGRNGANNVIMGERTVNPIEIYREDLHIYNQRQDIDRQLALKAEIEVIEKFIPYGDPKSGSLVKNGALGGLLGLILAIAFVLAQMLKVGLTRLRYSLEEETA